MFIQDPCPFCLPRNVDRSSYEMRPQFGPKTCLEPLQIFQKYLFPEPSLTKDFFNFWVVQTRECGREHFLGTGALASHGRRQGTRVFLGSSNRRCQILEPTGFQLFPPIWWNCRPRVSPTCFPHRYVPFGASGKHLLRPSSTKPPPAIGNIRPLRFRACRGTHGIGGEDFQ